LSCQGCHPRLPSSSASFPRCGWSRRRPPIKGNLNFCKFDRRAVSTVVRAVSLILMNGERSLRSQSLSWRISPVRTLYDVKPRLDIALIWPNHRKQSHQHC
jgi:hypothetical protein